IKQVAEYFKERGFKRHFIQRKGTPGYSEDIPRVLADYTVGLAGYMSRLRSVTAMKKAAVNIDARANPDLADYTSKYIQYLENPTNEASGFRSMLFMYYLGGNVKSAALNLTQPMTTTYPYLTKFANDAVVAKEMVFASRLAVKKAASLPKDLAVAVKKAEDIGVISEQYTDELRGKAKGQVLARSGTYWKALKVFSYLFGKAENFNRRVTFISSFNIAKRLQAQGKPLPPETPTPFEMAVRAVEDTQFSYGTFNRPPVGRGAIGATVLTFRTFMINYLELFRDIPAPQKARMLAVLGTLAGATGVPFADDLKNIIEWTVNKMGYHLDMEHEARKFMAEISDDPAYADVVLHGTTRLTPWYLGGSISLGDILPEPEGAGPYFGPFSKVVGPAANFIERPIGAYELYQKGQTGRAAERLLPEALRNALVAKRFAEEGARDLSGRLMYTPTKAEIAGKALSFQPSGLARTYERKEAERKTVGYKRDQSEIFYARLTRALFKGDDKEIQRTFNDIKKYNASVSPEFIFIPNKAVLKMKLQEMLLDESLAGIRGIPKALRAKILQERALYGVGR
ncbi:MAG: PLxRFG domain-containing protein, partial [Candidatus Brocadiales bacterium]